MIEIKEKSPMFGCLLCNGLPDDGYKPAKGIDFICWRCVQRLLVADADDLLRAYQKARQHGYTQKAAALKSFTTMEGKDDEQRRPERHRRHFDRIRTAKTFRDQSRRIGRTENDAQVAVL